MSMSDVIGDMLTRIRNAQKVFKKTVPIPYSRVRKAILKVLLDEGYIRTFVTEKDAKGFDQLVVDLKYYEDAPVIQQIRRCSKPGRRVYSSIKDLPLVSNGLGIYILSTSSGIISDIQARKMGVGGEVLCSVF